MKTRTLLLCAWILWIAHPLDAPYQILDTYTSLDACKTDSLRMAPAIPQAPPSQESA